MAKGTVEVNVAVETIIHKTLIDMIQHIWNEEQIRIENIVVEWRNVAIIGKQEVRVRSIHVESTSYHE